MDKKKLFKAHNSNNYWKIDIVFKDNNLSNYDGISHINSTPYRYIE